MTNRKFLDKAEQLKQPLIETVLTCEGSDRVLKDGDEIVFDMGKHCVGYTEIRLSSVGHHPDAPLLMSVQFAGPIRDGYPPAGSRRNGSMWTSFPAPFPFPAGILSVI